MRLAARPVAVHPRHQAGLSSSVVRVVEAATRLPRHTLLDGVEDSGSFKERYDERAATVRLARNRCKRLANIVSNYKPLQARCICRGAYGINCCRHPRRDFVSHIHTADSSFNYYTNDRSLKSRRIPPPTRKRLRYIGGFLNFENFGALTAPLSHPRRTDCAPESSSPPGAGVRLAAKRNPQFKCSRN